MMPRSAPKPIVQTFAISMYVCMCNVHTVRYCLSVLRRNAVVPRSVLNFCVRVVCGRRRHEHISDVYRDELTDSCSELAALYHRICSVHCVLVTGRPEAIADTFGQTARLRHAHDTRHISDITLPHIQAAADCAMAHQVYLYIPEPAQLIIQMQLSQLSP